MSGIYHTGNFGEYLVLLDHVMRFEHGTRKHELPMQRDAFALEQ
jgi:hypothetical protein